MGREIITLEPRGLRYGFNEFIAGGTLTKNQVIQGRNALGAVCGDCPVLEDCIPGALRLGNFNGLETLIFRGKAAGVSEICSLSPLNEEGSLVLDITNAKTVRSDTSPLVNLLTD